MARELLNHFVDTGGQWTQGQPEYFIGSKDESFGANGRDMKIHETAAAIGSPGTAARTRRGTIQALEEVPPYLLCPLRRCVC
jgi:hypothetical protein